MSEADAKKLPPCAAVIAAGGRGLRMGGDVRKQFIRIGGRSVLHHAVQPFLALPEVVRIAVALPADSIAEFERELSGREREVAFAVEGGETRQRSVRNALEALEDSGAELVAIHDAARPLVSPRLVRATFEAAASGDGAMACAAMRDTVKRGDGELVAGTVVRDNLWLAQTPQTFPLADILAAHRRAAEQGVEVTDDAALIEREGGRVRIVPGDPGNIKLTEPGDLEYVRWRLTSRAGGEGGAMELRIGEGNDLHRLEYGRKLVIGGVVIPYELGAAGHSDADVLLHAVTDALLGAAAEGDIGRLFPDDDPAYRDADSAELLAAAAQRVERPGWRPVNIDATVHLQRPRLAPHIEAIRGRIAEILGLPVTAVSVKAKTGELVGPVGEGRAVAARAVCLLTRTKLE